MFNIEKFVKRLDELSDHLGLAWFMSESEEFLAEFGKVEEVPFLSKQATTKTADAIQKSLTPALSGQYNQNYSIVIDDALNALEKRRPSGVWRKSDIDFVTNRVSKGLSKSLILDPKLIDPAASSLYELERIAMATELKTPLKLSGVDRQLQKFLQDNSKYWASKLSDGIDPRVTDIISNTLGDTELTRKNSLTKLRKDLLSDTGVRGRKVIRPPGTVIPPGWKGSLKDYYTGMTQNLRTQAQSLARITTFELAGVESFRVTAILDNRTSDVCQLMDGTVFSVADGIRLRDKILAMNSPADLKEVAGWRSVNEIKSISKARGGRISGPGASRLAKAGVALPPYHFRCRTEIVPI